MDDLELWTVEEVAQRLKLARSRVFALVASKQIDSLKIGKSRRFRPAAVAAFIEAMQQQAESEAGAR
jgi:excisionase family DNA binding protein